MIPKTGCPCADTLYSMIDGGLSEPQQAELTAHLDECVGCQQKLEHLAVGDDAACMSVCRGIDKETPAHDSAFWPALKQVRDAAATIAAVTTPPDPNETGEIAVLPPPADVDLSFLTAPDKPEYLGRLGRYNVIGLVGRGGMGLVLRSLDVCLRRQVAVKVLDPQLAGNKAARERFFREAQTAAQVQHENVVTIHHVEKRESDGLPYLVMQLVAGESLQDLLDRGDLPSVRAMIDIGRQTALGLAAAHERGLIHRDVKPGNVLIEAGTGRVKLTDFGLARCAEDVKLTQTGFVAGTPLYMSPEQARGESLDYRTDLFSLGSVLYAMASGQPPFQGSSPFVVLQAVTEKRPKPLREVNPAIPPGVADLVDRLLEKKPDDRYQSANDVAEVLAAELALLPVTAEVRAVTLPRLSRLDEAALPVRGRRWGWIALGFALGLATGMVVAHLAGWLQLPWPTGDAPLKTLRGNTGAVWSLSFSPIDNTLAVAVEDGSVKMIDLATEKPTAIQGHKGPVWTVAHSLDGLRALTASDDGLAIVWDTKTGQQSMPPLKSPSATFTSAAFAPDGSQIATGDRTGKLGIWSGITPGDPVLVEDAHRGILRVVKFSPDGKLIATAGSDSMVRLWDNAGNPKGQLPGHGGPVYTLSFSPDGERLASGSWDGTVRLWDVRTGTTLQTLHNSKQDVWAVAFSPDGKTLAVANHGGTVELLDANNGKPVKMLQGHERTVHSLAFSKDGKTLATGGRDGTVRLWDVGGR